MIHDSPAQWAHTSRRSLEGPGSLDEGMLSWKKTSHGAYRGRCFGLFLLLFVVMLVPQTSTAQEQQNYQLRYQFSPNQTYHFVTQNDTRYVVEFSQAKETVTHTSMSIRQLAVLGVEPDGTATLELRIIRARMTARNGGVDSLYDSTQPDAVPTEFAGVHQSIGKPIQIRMTPLGTILPDVGRQTPPIQDDLLMRLPESPVTRGATWKETFEIGIQAEAEGKLQRPVKMQRKYELKSVEAGIASIAVNTVSLSPITDPFQESQLIQRQHSGTIKFDLQRGCLVDRVLRIDEKVVGNQGRGTALSVQLVKVDRQIPADSSATFNLSEPILPVQVAAESTEQKN